MPFDDFRQIARIAEVRLREEVIHAFNNSMAGRDNTGRTPIAFVGELARESAIQNKRKRAIERFIRDIQQIIEDGKLNTYIAIGVFGSKSDAAISEIALEIESKTGMTLTDYAAGIIGADAAQRRPGEAEADYRRRILGAVAEEIIDPATGRIKPEYADDPLAQIIMADETYRSILADVEKINRNGIDADALVTKFAQAGYDSAELAGHSIELDPQKSTLRDGQEISRDAAANADPELAESNTFFAKPLTR